MYLQLRTVLSGVPNDLIRLGSWSKLISGLDFDLVRHVGVRVVDHMFGPLRGHIAPLLPRVLPSPPHTVAQVWAVSLQVEQRLEGRDKIKLTEV